jgi:ATP-dependent Clp protease ATP-binding subunit ClpA
MSREQHLLSFIFFDQSLIPVLCLLGSAILAHPSASDSSCIVARTEVLECVKEEFPLDWLNLMPIFNQLRPDSNLCIVSLWLADIAGLLVQQCIKLNVGDAAHSLPVQRGFSDVYGIICTEVLFLLVQKLLVSMIR